MGYKLLGYTVRRGARWYLRRRVGGLVSRRAAAAGIVGAAIAALAVAGARRGSAGS